MKRKIIQTDGYIRLQGITSEDLIVKNRPSKLEIFIQRMRFIYYTWRNRFGHKIYKTGIK